MLLSNTACEKALGELVSDDFYKPANALIFGAIKGLYEHGQSIDPVTVSEELNRSGGLELVGGPGTLLALQAATPATSSAPKYARIIAEHSVLRKLIAAANEISEACYDLPDSDQIDAIAVMAYERLAEAMQGVSREEVEDLWLLDDFLDQPLESRPPWVIPGLLRKGWRAMVVAAEGVGKTVLFRQIGIAAAQGIHPLHFQPIPPIRVLIVDLENPEDSIHDVCQPIRTQAKFVAGDAYSRDQAFLWHRPGGINLRNRRDRIELESVIAETKPDLVCLGPIYKAYSINGNESDELAAKEVMQCFDDLRTRYDFALLLEHHAAKGSGKSRELQPYGSSLWLRWPELGLKLTPDQPDGTVLRVGRWRGDRLENSWPKEIKRSKPWLWEGIWPAGTFNDPKSPKVPTTVDPVEPPASPFFGSASPPVEIPPGLDPETGEWNPDYVDEEPWDDSEPPPY